MTEMRDEESGARIRLKDLRCRRTGQMLTPQQHHECPYCFGKEEEIGKGGYDAFCDYKAGEDPISFGFPPDDVRRLKG